MLIMRRKYFFFAFVAVLTMIFSNLAVSAQTGQLFGEVTMTQADGTVVPAAGATIDVYRTDLPGHYPNKTDKKGHFMYAGLPFVGTYIIVASAPNARPDAVAGAKAGKETNYKLNLSPGNGKRPTEAEAKAMAGTGTSGSGGGAPAESAEDRKKREELLAKNAEIEAGNKKIEESNSTVTRTFKAGNEALGLKKYDEAIALYTEGINADPAHPGAPSLLTNKSVALRARAVDAYNAAINSKDEATKPAALEKAKKDFSDAAEAATKAVDMIKALPVPTDAAAQTTLTANKYYAMAARAEAMRLVASKVDQSQADAAQAAFLEYIAVETNPEKKAKAQTDMAQMLLDAGKSDQAFAEFQKILTEHPENIDAMLGSGLALFQSGDKANFQRAANYLQLFVDKAPDTHKLKASAKDALDYLKSQENVKPQKTTTTTGGRRRG
jgi:tetratricopeptide (TPR) repeat protein